MNTLFSFITRILARSTWLLAIVATVFGLSAKAQTIISPEPTGTTYSVKPDYRKCAFPMCGGWFLTPVNQYSVQLQDEDEAYQSAALLPNSIYVAYINYKQIGLTEKQIDELNNLIHSEQVLLRGKVSHRQNANDVAVRASTLQANGAWVSANKNPPVGPYVKVASTGIVCITTPCPYFKANLLNTRFSSEIHDLSFAKAMLDREQEARAWQAVSTDGLVMTATTYPVTGFDPSGARPGTGVGLAATKVFFAFPAKK